VLLFSTPPAGQLLPVRRVFHRVDAAAGAEVSTMYSSIGLAFLPSQVGAALMGSVGVLGLLLAAVGLCGVMLYSVARRTREIGVRVAMGARRGDIVRMVLLESGRMMAAGSVFGFVIAGVITRPLVMFLVPGISTTAPAGFVSVVAILALAGFAATFGPVRRALAVDPLTSLRSE
jgi:ABC-type antimicrobial peptide transport system permease subunit